jgi:hypothetical protein
MGGLSVMFEPVPPFGAARLKIERAGQHIAELRIAISGFLASKPVEIIVEAPDTFKLTQSHVWTARVRNTVPLAMSSILGDAVHNLRTALDLLASDLAKLNGKNPAGVHFPFAGDVLGLDDQIRRKNFTRAGPQAVKLLRSLKPYKGGNIALRGLHDLDLQDKHQAVLPTISAVSLPGFALILGTKHNLVPEWKTTVTHDGQMILIMPAIDNLAVGTEMKAHLSLVFGEGGPFAEAEIIPTLETLRENVVSTVEAFEALFPTARFPPTTVDPATHGRRTLLIGDPRRA